MFDRCDRRGTVERGIRRRPVAHWTLTGEVEVAVESGGVMVFDVAAFICNSDGACAWDDEYMAGEGRQS